MKTNWKNSSCLKSFNFFTRYVQIHFFKYAMWCIKHFLSYFSIWNQYSKILLYHKIKLDPLTELSPGLAIHGLIYFPWSHPRRPGPSTASYIQFLRSWKLPRQVAIHIEVLAVLNIEFMKPLAAYRRGVLKIEQTDKWIFHRFRESRILGNREVRKYVTFFYVNNLKTERKSKGFYSNVQS